ncbi:hypothetical protein [Flavobacterium praedii]|uniref:hypothetical protein n=1 Tax=Flavobacterium praedii TaxID=3002900 RepID=UPI002481BBA8|nr:hypothetical protein [Flavobacterium praedii]
MATISNLQENIIYLQSQIEELSSLLSSEPQNFAVKIQIENYQSEITNLQSYLYTENLKRNKEIIALRLIGNIAKNGTFPLGSVGGITNSFSNALYKTSQFLQFGKKGGKKIEALMKNSLDIRLEGLGVGSTIFYVSAKTSPDIFGNSIVQNSLENTFELFSSNDESELMENIEKVGTKNSKYFSAFLEELIHDNLEVEITWESPNYETKKWFGTSEKISMFYNTFKSIEILEPETLSFESEIITLSLKNKIEVFDRSNNHTYTVKYPNSIMTLIKELHVGEVCNIVITKTTIINTLSQKEKFEYNLVEIN